MQTTLVDALSTIVNGSVKKPYPLVCKCAQLRKFKMILFGKVCYFGVLPVRNPLESSGINGESDGDVLRSNLTLINFPIGTGPEITKLPQLWTLLLIFPLVWVAKVIDFTRNKMCCQSNIALVENYQI